jgi:hypothetical protein
MIENRGSLATLLLLGFRTAALEKLGHIQKQIIRKKFPIIALFV